MAVPPGLSGWLQLIPTYFGDELKTGIEEFFDAIENVATLATWTEQIKLVVAKGRLREEAARFIRDSESTRALATYNDFKTALTNHFKPDRPTGVKLAQFMEMCQKEKENARQYAVRVEKVGRELKDLDKAAQDKLILAQYIKSLKATIRHTVISKDPKTLKEAIEFSILEEDALLIMAERPRHAAVKKVTIEERDEDRYESKVNMGSDKLAKIVLERLDKLQQKNEKVQAAEEKALVDKQWEQVMERLDKLSATPPPPPTTAEKNPFAVATTDTTFSSLDSLRQMFEQIDQRMDRIEKEMRASFVPKEPQRDLGPPRLRYDERPPRYVRPGEYSDYRSQRRPMGPCYLCNREGHYAAQCPQRPSRLGPYPFPENRQRFIRSSSGSGGNSQGKEQTAGLDRTHWVPVPRPSQHVKASYDLEPESCEEVYYNKADPLNDQGSV